MRTSLVLVFLYLPIAILAACSKNGLVQFVWPFRSIGAFYIQVHNRPEKAL